MATIKNPITVVSTGGGGDDEGMTAEQRYRKERPADWIPMPDPVDGVLWGLLHRPNNDPEERLVRLSGNAGDTVEFGDVVNGVFTPDPDLTVTLAGGNPESIYLKASDFSHAVSDGKQLLMKITRNGTFSNYGVTGDAIFYFLVDLAVYASASRFSTASQLSSVGGITARNLLYTWLQIPGFTGVIGSLSNNADVGRPKRILRYFEWGTNVSTGSWESRFCRAPYIGTYKLSGQTSVATSSSSGLQSASFHKMDNLVLPQLTALDHLFSLTDTNLKIENVKITAPLATSAVDCFYGQDKLKKVVIDVPNLENATGIFSGCSQLQEISGIDYTKLTTITRMYQNCASLPPRYINSNFPAASGNYQQLYAGCSQLKSLPAIDTSNATLVAGMFNISTIGYYDLSNYDFSSVTNYGTFITECYGKTIIFPSTVTSIPNTAAMLSNQSVQSPNQLSPCKIVLPYNGIVTLVANASTIFTSNNYTYIYVPDSLVESYKTAQYWSTISTRIKPMSEL